MNMDIRPIIATEDKEHYTEVAMSKIYGTNISSALIPQKNVQNLEQDISTLAEGVMMREDELNAFKKEQLHFNNCTNKDIEDCGGEIRRINSNVEDLHRYTKLLAEGVMLLRKDHEFFADQQEIINRNCLKQIESLTKETMIQFYMIILLFIIDLGVIWFYIRK